VNGDRSAAKDTPKSVDFRNVQIVHKLAWRVTPNYNFKVKVKYLENGTR